MSPEEEQPEPDPGAHWAFRVPQRPAAPNERHRIDAFIDRELARNRIAPQPAAPKHVLL